MKTYTKLDVAKGNMQDMRAQVAETAWEVEKLKNQLRDLKFYTSASYIKSTARDFAVFGDITRWQFVEEAVEWAMTIALKTNAKKGLKKQRKKLASYRDRLAKDEEAYHVLKGENSND